MKGAVIMSEAKETKAKATRIGLRPATEILADMAGGDVERELTALMGEVARACDGTKKKGKITITLNFNPSPKMMAMTAEIKATIPKTPLEATSFYTDDKGGLHIENPRQTKLFDGPKVVTRDEGE